MRHDDSIEGNGSRGLRLSRNDFLLFGRNHYSFHSFFRWAVVFLLLPVILVSGCGYKEDLEKARTRITQSDNENRELSNQIVGLKQENTKLNDQVAEGKKEIETLGLKADKLKKDNTALEQRLTRLTADFDTCSLKNVQLTNELNTTKKEMDELRKRLSELDPVKSEKPVQPSATPSGEVATKELSPCDSLIEFMRKSEQIIRSNKGQERKKLLEQLKSEYSQKWKGAPKVAIESAQSWVREMSRSWDKHDENTVFLLIKYRNSVLKACGKDPERESF